jgi:DDE family transposase
MSRAKRNVPAHRRGGQPAVDRKARPEGVTLDSWAGRVHVEWDPEAPLTPIGQASFFIEFLKASGVFDALVADCPLDYTSPNAPNKRDVLGTAVLSMLSGHKRYAHIASLRADGVLPELLGLTRVMSEDAVRRGLKAIPDTEGIRWLSGHLDYCTAPLLGEDWVLDVDTTIKPLYGHQEGAELGYNPKKPGRPSHVYHSYMLANVRLVLDVEVMSGNKHTSNHSAPGLWALLDRVGRDCWPTLLRGDKSFSSDALMSDCEARGLPYLLRLRLTNNVKRAIERMAGSGGWKNAGQGWEGIKEWLQLSGWSQARRVILLRRRIKEQLAHNHRDDITGQLRLSFAEIDKGEVYEYAALVTSLDAEILTLGQLYRDRADCENIFDELKNQWGWGGFTTHDLARCRLAARLVALVYNWWNLFVRLAEPTRHLEAITSRPLLLTSIAERLRHARQTTLRIASTHAEAHWAAHVLARIAEFLRGLTTSAEQLTPIERWYRILTHALRHFLKGRVLRPPPRLPAPGV